MAYLESYLWERWFVYSKTLVLYVINNNDILGMFRTIVYLGEQNSGGLFISIKKNQREIY